MKNIKKVTLTLLTMALIIIALTIGIGSYFVNYALVPNQDAQDRQVDSTDLTGDEEYIEEQRSHAWELRDQWLASNSYIHEDVSIDSQDGIELAGTIYRQENQSHQWVIIAHGYQSDAMGALDVAPHFFEAGYNILSIDFRAHGESEGDYIGMGYLDSPDLITWTDFLIDLDSESEIIYHGTSMGAATVLMAASHDLPGNVKAIIADCGYSGIWEIFASELEKRFGLPSFPVLDMGRIVANFQAGYDIKDGDVISAAGNIEMPTLIIHGESDDFVPVEMGYEIYDALSTDDKELLIIEDAGHGYARYHDPSTYYGTIFDFLNNL